VKFHQIKLLNLNSLYGEHKISFDEDIRNSPIFLIIGPTGSGKSTILDAICLAMFGQTPRLNRKTGKPETEVGHILSQGTAQSYAEVEFSSKDGAGKRTRYLATWSCRRAYNNPEGAVQKPERSLYLRKPSGELQLVVSDHREKFFQPHFDVALQGLDVGDFQRTILLAQGAFNAFLKASSKEKANILERLTRTDKFRKIGELAAIRKREVDRKFQTISIKIKELYPDSDLEPEGLKNAVKDSEKALKRAKKNAEKARKNLAWKKEALSLELELRGLNAVLQGAEKDVKNHQDLFNALIDDEKVRDLKNLIEKIETLEKESKALELLIPELKAGLVEEGKKEDLLNKELVERQNSVLRARGELKDAQPDLKRAIEMQTQLQNLVIEKRSLETDLESERHLFSTVQREVQTSKAKAAAIEKSLVSLNNAVEKLGARVGLPTKMVSIRSLFESVIAPAKGKLQTLDLEIDAAQKEIQARKELIGLEEPKLKKLKASLRAQKAAATRAARDLEQAVAANKNRPLSELRSELDYTNAKAQALRESKLMLIRIEQSEAEKDDRYRRITEIETFLDRVDREIEGLKKLEKTQIELQNQLAQTMRLNEKVRALSELRESLHEGLPCPLCGSPIHPFCASEELSKQHEIAELDFLRLKKELKIAESAVQETRAGLQKATSKKVAKKTQRRHEDAQIIAVKERLEQDQRVFGECLEKAGFNPMESFQLKNSALLEGYIADAEQGIELLRLAVGDISSLSERVAGTKDSRARLISEVSEIESRVDKLDNENTNQETFIVGKQDAKDSLILARENAWKDISKTLKKVDIALPESFTIDEIEKESKRIATLEEQRLAFQKTKENLEHNIQTLDKESEIRKKGILKLEHSLKQTLKKLKKSEKIKAHLFDGKNPENIQKEFEDAIDRSEKEKASVVDKLRKYEDFRIKHNERLENAERDLEKKGLALGKELATQDTKLNAIDFSLEKAKSVLLSDKKRLQYQEVVTTLNKSLDDARSKTELLSEKKTSHFENRPKKFEEREVPLLESLAMEGEKESEDLAVILGQAMEKWEVFEKSERKVRGLVKEQKKIGKELDIWTAIYQTIGVGNGQRFQQFAQSLNLKGLIDRANHRLSHLYPRYQLALPMGGGMTLDFIIKDRYQANSERPLTTLSGGETFLVSLALALALADYRQIAMPIETLLLDEGFGTLDEDALHLALSTLHQLHRDGERQIGIISHVASLREMVDSRIVVEPRGHGQSTIRFEFGSDEVI